MNDENDFGADEKANFEVEGNLDNVDPQSGSTGDTTFDFSEDLVKAYQEAELSSKADRSKKIPDGKYEAVISKVSPEMYQGKPKLSMQLKITNGNSKNRIFFNNYPLATPVGLSRLKNDINTLGLKLDDIRQLKEMVGEMLDKRVAIVIKTNASNTKYQNCYINSLLSTEDELPADDPFN